MIVSRAPVRISFAGGGTDLPAFYERSPGLVVSAAINRYAHAQAGKPLDGSVRLASANLKSRASYRRGQRPAVSGRLAYLAAVVEHFWDAGIRERGVDLSVRCDVAPGSGLGSSSAVLVALIGAVSQYCEQTMSQAEIADLACRLEIERLRRPIGKQDQYASVFGGINAIAFSPDGVTVERVRVPGAGLQELSRWLLLFSTGITRDSADILAAQSDATRQSGGVQADLDALRELASRVWAVLAQGNLHYFGTLLDEGWQIKRGLIEGISSPLIDQAYAAARASGALGGKLCGAGGGGYLLLCCPPESRRFLRVMMARHGLEEMSVMLEAYGVRAVSSQSAADRRSVTRSPQRRR